MREGMRTGWTMPAEILEPVVAELKNLYEGTAGTILLLTK